MCRFIILLGSRIFIFFGSNSSERKRQNEIFKGFVVKVPIFMQMPNLKCEEKINRDNKNSENFLYLSNFISASMNKIVVLQFKWNEKSRQLKFIGRSRESDIDSL